MEMSKKTPDSIVARSECLADQKQISESEQVLIRKLIWPKTLQMQVNLGQKAFRSDLFINKVVLDP